MATIVGIVQLVKLRANWVFQSIGVTKDWRPGGDLDITFVVYSEFPINRRHKGLATLMVEE